MNHSAFRNSQDTFLSDALAGLIANHPDACWHDVGFIGRTVPVLGPLVGVVEGTQLVEQGLRRARGQIGEDLLEPFGTQQAVAPERRAEVARYGLRVVLAATLGVGDRVWFRHAKSGEPAERIAAYHLVSGDEVIDELPTYRGEGKAFL